ncbi:pancreatic lipase-related protein 2-like [Aricia agestis]|uniref:pancreatic lipase-related protein 2-like n=1 Tax=Aricia agestis TaxID=91739 RepID=UPI001C20BAAF|nr:pancreatic lipase-related protein 2-like [Aricia agestis]
MLDYLVYVYCLTWAAQVFTEEVLPTATMLPIPTITPGPNSCETFKSLFGLTYKQMRAKNITYNMLKIDHITSKNEQVDLTDINKFLENIKGPKNIILLIHGFMESSKGAMVQTLAREYKKKDGVEIFAVDGRNAIGIEYFVSTTYARFLGEELGWFLGVIVKNGVNPAKISVVGHSLGAHIAGVAGQVVQENTGQKLGRITGLDPARPCFTNIHPEGRLDPSDAGFVDVIHTNAGVLGLSQSVGHLDFYPNGGSSQPGCVLTTCHHSRAWEFFAETIMSPDRFPGRKCWNLTSFQNGDCRNNKVAYMGARLRSVTPGKYYLSTSESPPFGLGESGSG